MSDLITKVKETIKKYEMLKGNEKIIVGVSGGADSICLLHVLMKLRLEYHLKLLIAHLNHGLREEESLRDEAFIRKLGEQFQLPTIIMRVNPEEFKNVKGISIQEKARQLRYNFFYEILKKEQGDKIALGHNADDQAETLLLWLIRGTGTKGLSGIPPVRENIFIRPLIEVERSKIEQFLKQMGIEYLQDSSNVDKRYLRNRIRLELIPNLKKNYNPKIVSTLNQTANIIRLEDEFLDKYCEKCINDCLIKKYDNSIILNVVKLQLFPLPIQLRLLRKIISSIKGNLTQIRYVHIFSIIKLLKNTGSNNILNLPGGIQVVKEYDRLVVSRGKQTKPNFIYYFNHIPNYVKINEINKVIRFSLLNREDARNIFFNHDKNIAYLDYKKVIFPIIIRQYQSGDRFSPIGMTGNKKVREFFIDKKIPISERLRIPILVFNTRIAWIIGYIVDRELAADKNTERILKVIYEG